MSKLEASMSRVSLAPSYHTLDPNHASSSSSRPTSFSVGNLAAASFVTPDDLRRHLTLLAAFARLRRSVEAIESPAVGSAVDDPRARWTVFLHRAEYRYRTYVHDVVAKGQGVVPLPPLDVAMVWHTHLLNPANFAEDKLRTFPELDLLSDRLLTEFVDEIEPKTFVHRPSDDQTSIWTTETGLAFDPIEAYKASEGRTITCPRTGDEIFVPWVNSSKTGYAQQGFRVSSPSSPSLFEITHEVLGVAKLSQDLYLFKHDDHGRRRGLANTVVNPFNALSDVPTALAASLAELVPKVPVVQQATSGRDIAERLNWNREDAFTVLASVCGGTKHYRKINGILEAYATGSPFSLDLAMATLRQSEFISKMSHLGWTSPEWILSEEETLYRCVARYHAFLGLLANHLSLMAVPTLDIDLAWHTHQLKSTYRRDSAEATGRAIDHDDKVEESDLGWGFDDTAKFWQEDYKVPYHSCGCPLPHVSVSDKAKAKLSSSKLGSRLASLKGSSSSSSSSTTDPTSLEQTSQASSSTHSSEHNAVILTSQPDAIRRRSVRTDEVGGRKKKGAVTDEHALAFLRPIPMWDHYGTDGYPSDSNDIALNANQAGTDLEKGTCGGSAGDPGGAAKVGACGAASGVYLVASPTPGGRVGYMGSYGWMVAAGSAGGAGFASC
ncbi:hypothetical protein JCM10212_004084 [Sporobolomyces blumeae]